MARWSDEKTLNFVNLYRKYECLWNVRSPLYKNTISRRNAYQSMLESLNDVNLNMKSVRTKIKNLRSIYHTELKKVKLVKDSGSVYKPGLSWFELMHSFLGDSTEYHDTSSTEYHETLSSEIETQISADNTSELATQDTNEATLQWNQLDTQSTPINSVSAVYSEPPQKDTNEALRRMKPKIIRKKRLNEDNSILNALQRLEKIAEVVNTPQQPTTVHSQDEFHFFALSVAAQLRNLPLSVAIETQSKIQNTLSAARLSSIIPSTPSPSTSYNYSSPLSDQPSHLEAQDTTSAQYAYVKMEATQESEQSE